MNHQCMVTNYLILSPHFCYKPFQGQTKVNMAVYVPENYLFNSFTLKTPSAVKLSIEATLICDDLLTQRQGRSSQ